MRGSYPAPSPLNPSPHLDQQPLNPPAAAHSPPTRTDIRRVRRRIMLITLKGDGSNKAWRRFRHEKVKRRRPTQSRTHWITNAFFSCRKLQGPGANERCREFGIFRSRRNDWRMSLGPCRQKKSAGSSRCDDDCGPHALASR